MAVIVTDHLSKHYQVHKKEPGFIGSIKSLFSRKYETVKAVDDVSFSINEGEVVGFIGPNGAGKTTTLKCLSGLLYPTKGKVSVLDFIPFNRKSAFLKQISLVMGQKNQLWWDLPAMDTFLLNKEIYQIPTGQFEKVLGDLSDRLGVKDILHIPVRKLSLGQRMKMELIASLLHSPKVLFLDEPTIGLDVVMQKTIRAFLKEYNQAYNATIILTSHYMGDVEALCKRVIVINFGKILYDGLLSDLVREHAPYKIIKIILSEKIDEKKLPEFGETRSYSYPEWEVRIKHENANEIASKILKQFPVEDITIEDPQMEDVIAGFFSANKKG
ncbi:MAG: ABC transporter ATP-binding protein [Candidatus Levybacteria bacterium]|nr:ABC transporter ATP-binding protein [Candidatus Levybacteria bacterium]